MVEESGCDSLEFRVLNCPIGSHVGHVDELSLAVAVVVALRFLDVLNSVRIVPLGSFFSGLC